MIKVLVILVVKGTIMYIDKDHVCLARIIFEMDNKVSRKYIYKINKSNLYLHICSRVLHTQRRDE